MVHVGIPSHAVGRYRQHAIHDSLRGSRANSAISAIIISAVKSSPFWPRLEELALRGRAPNESVKLVVDLYDFDRYLGEGVVAIAHQKRKGRNYIVKTYMNN